MQRARRMAAKGFYRRHNEQFECNHGRNWISRQAEYRLIVAHTEHSGTPGPNRQRIEEKLDSNLFQYLLYVVVFAYRHATGKNHNVGFQRLLNSNAEFGDVIGRNP